MKNTARTAQQLGELIRHCRKSRNMTQGDVSKITNLRVATISSLENGDPGTKLRTVMSIMAALNLEFAIQDRSASTAVSIEDIFS